MKKLFTLVGFILISNLLFSQEFNFKNISEKEKIQIKPIFNMVEFQGKELLLLALEVTIDNGWHINPAVHQIPKNYPVEVIPTSVKIKNISNNLQAQSPIYPKPYEYLSKDFGEKLYHFEKTFYIIIPIYMQLKENESYDTNIQVSYQICSDSTCLMPSSKELQINILPNTFNLNQEHPFFKNKMYQEFENQQLTIQNNVNNDNAITIPLFGYELTISDTDSFQGILFILILAFIGGVLLNFTPCVLPVIPLKIMSLTKSSSNKSQTILLGFVMLLGIIFFWLCLAGLIVSVNQFDTISQLFQYPSFSIVIGSIIIVMAIAMLDVFQIPVPRSLTKFSPRFDSIHGSFGVGIMTAILSTPCTAPIMGSISAWSVKQSPTITILVFFTIGLGMAIPYFLLSIFPSLLNFMPKAGLGSVALKKVLSFLLIAAGLYFLCVGLYTLAPFQSVYQWYWLPPVITITISAFMIIYYLFLIKPKKIFLIPLLIFSLLLIYFSIVGIFNFTKPSSLPWQDYEPKTLALAKKNDELIILDFTAHWCLNCQVLEKNVLESEEIKNLVFTKNIRMIKVDIEKNPLGKGLLKEYGSITIPYLVIYQGEKILFKADNYLISTLQEVLNK